jgi:hypothetical protein
LSDFQNNIPIARGAGRGQIFADKLITPVVLRGKGLLLPVWENDRQSVG